MLRFINKWIGKSKWIRQAIRNQGPHNQIQGQRIHSHQLPVRWKYELSSIKSYMSFLSQASFSFYKSLKSILRLHNETSERCSLLVFKFPANRYHKSISGRMALGRWFTLWFQYIFTVSAEIIMIAQPGRTCSCWPFFSLQSPSASHFLLRKSAIILIQ